MSIPTASPSGCTRFAAGINSRPGPGPISRTLCPGRSPNRSRVIRVPLNRWRIGFSSNHPSDAGHGIDHRRLIQRQPRLNATKTAARPRSIAIMISAVPVLVKGSVAAETRRFRFHSARVDPLETRRFRSRRESTSGRRWAPRPGPNSNVARPSRIGNGRVRISR